MSPLPLFLVYYLISVVLETGVLWAALSPVHSLRRRLFAGVWLTSCSYPIVVFTLPLLTRENYLWAAETFAPLSECALFAASFSESRGRTLVRDCAAIVLANLTSFAFGLLVVT